MAKQDMQQEQIQLDERLIQIQHKILVLSGKGGVGKSTMAANLAIALALSGKEVGLLDIDIHGPSIPRLFGLEGQTIQGNQDGLYPVLYRQNLKVMSIGFLLPRMDDAVIWRGPMKYNLIKQFIKDVQWGHLDYLIVDSPPGTGDEPLAVAQLIHHADGALIITTPQQLAINDVRKSIEFCHVLKLPVLGVIENMSGFICPHCQTRVDIFKSGGGKEMAESMNVPFLGAIPLEPELVQASDRGVPYLFLQPESATAQALQQALIPVMNLEEKNKKEATMDQPERKNSSDPGIIRIAIPLEGERLAAHFGHCDVFFIADVDRDTGEIVHQKAINPPAHQPGMLPPWLQKQGVNLIIAGGIGERAKLLFRKNGIEVLAGAPEKTPGELISELHANTLVLNETTCDHGLHQCQDNDHEAGCGGHH